MLRFDFVLKHIASKSIGKVNSLSRRADWAKEIERDNESCKLKKKLLKKLEVKNNEVVKVLKLQILDLVYSFLFVFYFILKLQVRV